MDIVNVGKQQFTCNIVKDKFVVYKNNVFYRSYDMPINPFRIQLEILMDDYPLKENGMYFLSHLSDDEIYDIARRSKHKYKFGQRQKYVYSAMRNYANRHIKFMRKCIEDATANFVTVDLEKTMKDFNLKLNEVSLKSMHNHILKKLDKKFKNMEDAK